MNHLYWGDGKGKTTASMGMALRALAAGWRVLIVQFLKSTPSGEIQMLEQLGADIRRENPHGKFVYEMTETEKRETRSAQDELLRSVADNEADLIIFDEAIVTVALGMLDEALLRKTLADLQARKPRPEIVMTGRKPADWMHEWADYDTEMRCVKHPYDNGLLGRVGVEL